MVGLILSNDLADQKVFTVPVVTDGPEITEQSANSESKPETSVHPAYVVTCAHSCNADAVNLAD